MRLAIATLIGGLVMFIWGVVAHTVLPLGQVSMRAPLNEDHLITALKDDLPAEHGIYVLPHFDMAKYKDDSSIAAFSAKTKASPYALIVYNPEGRDAMAMGHNLFHQWLADTIAALLVALVMLRAGVSATRGLAIGLAFGVFTWLTVSVPYWSWYRFPAPFTFAALIESAFGWLLAGAAMGWWLGRKRSGV